MADNFNSFANISDSVSTADVHYEPVHFYETTIGAAVVSKLGGWAASVEHWVENFTATTKCSYKTSEV